MAPRIHEPPLYSWELNENHTRYDYARVVPDGQTLHVQFSVLATVNAVVAVAVMTLIVSMLRSHAVMENTFNWYLLFIAAPDFLVSFFCLITCAMSAPINRYYSEAMCGFQSFYLSWAFASNAWLNGIIVYQIHKLLKYSSIRRRYFLPTKQQVIKHAFCVYLYGTCLGLVNAFHVPFLPHKAHLWYGFACLPIEYDRASTWFFWLVFQPCFLGVPMMYAAYVLFDIYRNKLLPPMGRRRNLSLFLLRLVFLYFAIWFPFLLIACVGNFAVVKPFIIWMGAVISHLQGLVSALFCLTNKDIRQAVKDFLAWPTNRRNNEDNFEDDGGQHFVPDTTAESSSPKRIKADGKRIRNREDCDGSIGVEETLLDFRQLVRDCEISSRHVTRRHSTGGSSLTISLESADTRPRILPIVACGTDEGRHMTARRASLPLELNRGSPPAELRELQKLNTSENAFDIEHASKGSKESEGSCDAMDDDASRTDSERVEEMEKAHR